MRRAWPHGSAWCLVLLWFGSLAGVGRGAEAIPARVLSGAGRFDVAAMEPSSAHAIAAAGAEAWRVLAGPLGLPEGFSTPIFVRLVPPGEGGDPAPFRVSVEPGGLVSVRIGVAPAEIILVRRALVQALLLRLAVARHGVTAQLTAPLWLEQACLGWWQTRAEAAQLDAWQQESARIAPAALVDVLEWERGGAEPRELAVAAFWLLVFLQNESGRGREWAATLQGLLGGDDAGRVIAANYPGRFADPGERELWWQTGYHHARRVRALPTLDAPHSRAQLAALARFVFAAADEAADQIVPLRAVVARAAEPVVAAELARRAAEVERLVAALHPFYRNAGLSLAEALRVGPKLPARREALCAAFEQDWQGALELEADTSAVLDEWEARRR